MMAPSNEAVKFLIASLDGSQPSSGTLTVTNVNVALSHSLEKKGRYGTLTGPRAWRCIITLPEKKRCYGPARENIRDAVEHQLIKFSLRIPDEEKQRLRAVASAMQLRRCGTEVGAATTSGSQPMLSGWKWQRGVSFVHQMHGLFGDDKSMSPLFKSSMERWQLVAKKMRATYHLWSAAEVESLVKQRYPQFWDMYCNVRYPIMRCDIGRLCIIHAYGGLYSDLDVLPNREIYTQVPLAVSRVSQDARASRKEQLEGLSAKVKAVGKEETGFLEMEVLVGAAGNTVFLDWLEHIKKEIASKPYHSSDSFWYTAKMRYVYRTTGPLSMQRFLRLSAKTQGMTFISSSWFKQTKNTRLKESAAFEVLSFESNSYFTKEHEIKVPVGLGDTPLMLEPVMKRMRCKCTSRRFGAKPAPSQEEVKSSEKYETPGMGRKGEAEETPGDIPMHPPGSPGNAKKRKLPSSIPVEHLTVAEDLDCRSG